MPSTLDPSRLQLALCGAALGLSAACTGYLDGPDGGSSAPGAQPPGGPGAGASSSTLAAGTDPGRVTLHRLNRAEYDNTVRDLLGTTLHPAEDFPIDDRGGGFDNMADVLTLSPLHLSVFSSAAKALVSDALQNQTQRATIVTCDMTAQGDACARDIVKQFAYRAWRRPVTDPELDHLTAGFAVARAHGDGYEEGLGLALRAVLLSPHFIFRVELDADPSSLTPHPLSSYELATRLSYFLWSSTPDAALLSSAAAGTLSDPSQLRGQVTRLLQDGRARALLDNFAGQWLQLRAIDTVAPDTAVYPSVDQALITAMKSEAELTFRDVAFEGAPLTQLLTASYTYLNDRLASHYGLPPVGSSELVRVDLTGNNERGGLLSQAGFLSITSHPKGTSPVKRGKWVLDELLCTIVPAPPPNVNLSAVEAAAEQGLTQRQALDRHRQDPTCNSCHQLMDPIGFGLENYDAIGGYRTIDAGSVIDAAGQLPTGEAFSGAKQLSTLIAQSPDFARCAAKKLYTYALGRDVVESRSHLDGATLTSVVEAFTQSGYSWSELVARIVTSPTFLNRRGEPASGGMP